MFTSAEQITTFLKHENYYNGVLINDPKPLPEQVEPYCSFFYSKNEPFTHSIIVPVHNQEQIIYKVLNKIVKNTINDYEMIIVLDSCVDNTEQVIRQFFDTMESKNLKKVKVIISSSPLFETTCDNIGLRLAEGNYVIEVQADIEIYTFGYDELLTRPIKKYDDIFAVSGRCVHSLHNWSNGKGKLGCSVEQPLNLTFEEYDKVFIGDTCNRGPLAYDLNKVKTLQYYDEQNFVQGDDDHDLNMRAKNNHNWLCGYVPIEFLSRLMDGSTRKARNQKNEEYLLFRRQRSNGGFISKIHRGEVQFVPTPIYTRDL